MLDRRFTDGGVGDYFGFIVYSKMEVGSFCNSYIVMNSTNRICSKKKEIKNQD